MSFGSNSASHMPMAAATSFSSTSAASREVQIIAAKFHSRSVELATERDKLQQIQHEHDQQAQIEQEMRQRLVKTRSVYLQAMRQSHGIELELRRLEEQCHTCQAEIVQYEQEAEKLEQEAVEFQDAWEARLEQFVGPHQLKRQLYQRHLEKLIETCQTAKERKSKRLEIAKHKTEEIDQTEHPWVMEQYRQVLADTDRLQQEEEAENETIRQLVEHVHANLKRVRSSCRSLATMCDHAGILILYAQL